ncbi:HAD family hydrolase [Cellulosimicrobium sp. SH8]|uniref:HAD family hydrolase n=1 Tax=Cellulosimicrobium sp. SH8 TaxID=2952936 RepID=UPI0021F3344B|nr:HAD-IA family hydrolase [Cellulosimicrobium sp. SH8]
MTVRHVLFDADGVLQHIPDGWYGAVARYLGDRAHDFVRDTWSEDLPMLVGDGDYLPVLAAGLERYGVAEPAEDVYRAIWFDALEVVEESFDLVRGLRASGYGVHLGTNQESRRVPFMRQTLGYDAEFDTSWYSCELGLAKPDPRFFVEAARRIGAEPGEVLFVDDTARNVEGARAAGMVGVHWDVSRGHDELVRVLAGHGVAVRAGQGTAAEGVTSDGSPGAAVPGP